MYEFNYIYIMSKKSATFKTEKLKEKEKNKIEVPR